MRSSKVMMFLAAFLATLACWASQTSKLVASRDAASKPVRLNVWHADLNKCKSYAKSHGVPLIAVWSNGEACPHCVDFESACNATYFKNWMKKSGCVFLFVYSGDKNNQNVFDFCYGGQALYPLIRVWWYKDGKKKLDTYSMGDTLDGTQDGTAGAKKAFAWLKKKLKNYKPSTTPATPKYTGGGFDTVEEEQARLEVEIDNTKPVEVPLSRASNASSVASTNTVLAVYPNGEVVTNTVVWAKNESEKSVVVDTASLTSVSNQVTLVLLDASGKAVATNHITAVSAVENSAKNPAFVGEKTADELKWGEWTMDLDVALAKVRAENGVSMHSARPRLMNGSPAKAHTLVLVEGSLWCGDCSAAERNFFGDQRFKDWARDNKVALVAIDVPSDPTNGDLPSLLNYNVTTNGDRYVTANFTPNYSNEALRVQSGSGYLSRHGISREAAQAVAERNAELVGTSTVDGGWNTPDRMLADKTKVRTGVPILLVLRDDGSVAGRFNQYSKSGPKEFEPGVLTRLEEIFDQIAEENEEANDDRMTTPETVGKREKVEGKTISFADATDVYRLKADETKGRRVKFSLSGEKDVTLGMKLLAYAASGTNSTLIAQASGKLSEGIELSGNVNSTNCFLQVSCLTGNATYPEDAFFAHTSTVSTVCQYTLESDFVVQPTEVADEVEITDDNLEMSITLVSNEVYRITSLAAEGNSEFLSKVGESDDLYTALVDGDVTLKLAGKNVTNQLWHPGKVGFAMGSTVVGETIGSYEIRLARTGGVSGRATMSVSLNAEKSSKLDNLFEIPEGFSDEVVWEDGDGKEKTLVVEVLDNPYADGDQYLYFTAVCGGDAEPGITEFRMTLRDNDKRIPGRLEISRSNPAISSTMTAFARAGQDMDVYLGRVDGADGTLSATLAASEGDLDVTEFSWAGRDKSEKQSTLSLPATPGKKVKVTLTPAKGTAVNADRRILTVNLLDPDVPGFMEGDVLIPATNYVPIAERRIKLDDKATDETTVKKFSGSLAPGLAWKFDKENMELVISGVPTKAGSTTASFRAYNGSKAGLTVAVTVDVLDPVKAGGGTGGTAPLNPSVAVSRTFKDVPLIYDSTNRLLGVLTLTLPRTGRASAKLRTAEYGTVSFSCANWDGFGEDGATLNASLAGVIDTNECVLAVEALPDGKVKVRLETADTNEAVAKPVELENFWSAANPATDFKGYYTVSLPRKEVVSGAVLAAGDAYVTLKMNTAAAVNSGSVTYAGVLPNGKPFSGVSTLVAKDWIPDEGFEYWKRAVVPLLSASAADTLAGTVQITPGAADKTATNDVNVAGVCEGRCSYKTVRKSVSRDGECDLVWSHIEAAEAISCEATLDVFGTYYDSTEDFKTCCHAALSASKLKLFAMPGPALDEEIVDSLSAGELQLDGATNLTAVTVTFEKATKKAKTKTSSIVSSDKKLSFTLGTGIVSGTLVLPYESGKTTLTYKGIVMPGWGDGNCGECSTQAGGATDTSRPFISGTAWFNDTCEYEDEYGRIRKATVRRSVPFSVGVQAGK